MLYCIKVFYELGEVEVVHHRFDIEPTRQEVLDFVDSLDIGYDDDYGKLEFSKVIEK